MAIFLDKNSQRDRAGHHRRRGLLPHRADVQVRHEPRRRRHAGQGRPEDARRACRSSTRSARRSRRPAPRTPASSFRRRLPPTRSTRRYDAGITFAVCITEGVPVHDTLKVVATTPGMRIIGPNCPGLVSPGKALVGIMPGHVFKEGGVGRGLALGHPDLRGGRPADPRGPRPVDLRRDRRRPDHRHDLRRLPARVQERPRRPRAIVVCGEIGGSDEEDAAAFIAEHMPEMPVVAFIGGRNAPPGKSLGPRRRDHLRQVRHPGEQDRGLYRRRRPGRRTAVRDPRPSSRALGGPRLSKRASAGRFPP